MDRLLNSLCESIGLYSKFNCLILYNVIRILFYILLQKPKINEPIIAVRIGVRRRLLATSIDFRVERERRGSSRISGVFKAQIEAHDSSSLVAFEPTRKRCVIASQKIRKRAKVIETEVVGRDETRNEEWQGQEYQASAKYHF